MKEKILHLVTEFTMVFLGVLLAFITNNWAEAEKDKKNIAIILDNLTDDVRKDSTNIIEAVDVLKTQHDSLTSLIADLFAMHHQKANKNIYCAYFSYNAFDPTTATFESLVFGGDLKLVADIHKLKEIKELDHINSKLRELQRNYHTNIESFRNSFICQYNVEHFSFESIPPEQGIEFWNRLNFLKVSVQNYLEALLLAQQRYNIFLKEAMQYKD
jgi:hypothetical protein